MCICLCLHEEALKGHMGLINEDDYQLGIDWTWMGGCLQT